MHTDTSRAIYDTHCHLISMQRKNPALVVDTKQAIERGELRSCIDIGIDPGDHELRLPLIRQVGLAWYTIGIYPSYATDPGVKNRLYKLDEDIKTMVAVQNTGTARQAKGTQPREPRLVAVGEIGVDFYHDYGPEADQVALLNAQIDIANTHGLPVVIHNREADATILKTILQNPPKAGGILHCFSSDYETAIPLLDHGFFLSFAGNITYNSAQNLRDAAKQAPADRILAETDSPYLSPVPFRGTSNKPPHVVKVYECLAQQRGQDLDALCAQIETNLKTFLCLS